MTTEVKLVDIYSDSCVQYLSTLRWLYSLMAEVEPHQAISHRAMPSYLEHVAFWEDRPFRYAYSIRVDGFNVGLITASRNNEIGIRIFKKHCGRGYGPEAIRIFLASHRPLSKVPARRSGCWVANIAPGNDHSRHVFSKLGAVKIQETYAFLEEAR